MTGSDPDRLIEIGDRTVEIVLADVGQAADAVGIGIFRIEPDCLGEVGNGVVVSLTLSLISRS